MFAQPIPGVRVKRAEVSASSRKSGAVQPAGTSIRARTALPHCRAAAGNFLHRQQGRPVALGVTECAAWHRSPAAQKRTPFLVPLGQLCRIGMAKVHQVQRPGLQRSLLHGRVPVGRPTGLRQALVRAAAQQAPAYLRPGTPALTFGSRPWGYLNEVEVFPARRWGWEPRRWHALAWGPSILDVGGVRTGTGSPPESYLPTRVRQAYQCRFPRSASSPDC